MEVALQEKQAELPLTTHNPVGSGRSATQRRKGLEAVLEPEAREDEEEDKTAKVVPAAHAPSAVSETRPPSFPAVSNNPAGRQAAQRRRKTVDSRSGNLPSRGRP